MTVNKQNSANFDGKVFRNLGNHKFKKSYMKLIKWRFTRKVNSWPDFVDNIYSEIPSKQVLGDDIKITFVNHATVLIQTQGLNILTDPVWSERVSPFSWLGPKRIRKPGIDFKNLPHIDLVLISHDHYDHLDLKSLKLLDKQFAPKIFAGLGIGEILYSHNIKCEEMDWGDAIDYKNTKIHFLPAKHWSGRKLFYGNNSTLWGSFVVQNQAGNIYFAGDTAYDKHFKDIQNQFSNFRVSLIPIGAYEPNWFMKESHMTPKEAAQAHLDLNSSCSIAIHYNTFRLSDEDYGQPEQDLVQALQELNIDQSSFLTLSEGKIFHIP